MEMANWGGRPCQSPGSNPLACSVARQSGKILELYYTAKLPAGRVQPELSLLLCRKPVSPWMPGRVFAKGVYLHFHGGSAHELSHQPGSQEIQIKTGTWLQSLAHPLHQGNEMHKPRPSNKHSGTRGHFLFFSFCNSASCGTMSVDLSPVAHDMLKAQETPTSSF